MTRQFHARVRRVEKPKPRAVRPHTLSFKCFRFVADDEIVELCDPRNNMRVFVFER